MTLRQKLKAAARAFRSGSLQKRGYRDVVALGGQNSDWLLQSLSEDADLWQNAYALTARVRDLFKTNPLYIKYRELLWANVFGADGHMLRMKVQETENRVVHAAAEKKSLWLHEERINRLRRWALSRNEKVEGRKPEQEYRALKLADALEARSLDSILRGTALVEIGAPDVYANQLIEHEKKIWQRKEFCDMRGTRNYFTLCQLRLMGAVTEGDLFIRLIRDPRINRFGFTTQLISAQWCDRFLNCTLANGNVIRMGIEYQMTDWGLGAPVAYYFIKRVPQDWQWNTGGMFGISAPKNDLHQRVEARDILHYARPVEAESTRPAPWVASTIPKGRQLDQYELAEVIAAREAACKTGFFWSDVNPEGGMSGTTIDPTSGVPTQALAPGETGALPWGVKYQERDPKHPTMNFEGFRKGMVRSITAGMPAADYNTLANDLENINFSAGRLGRLDTNEMSKLLQRFDIDSAERPIFEAWLEMALITGAVPLPLAKYPKFNKPVFQGRRWAQVDETKAVNAAALRVANKFSSRSRECADEGIDFEENLMELAEEEMLIDELGLKVDTTVEKPEATPADEETDPESGNTKKPAAKTIDAPTNDKDEPDMTEKQTRALLDEYLPKFAAAQGQQTQREVTASQPLYITFPPIENKIDMSKFVLPEQKAPIVNVAQPAITIEARATDTPAPVINISPTPVTIENTVNVPAATSVRINRNDEGEMTGATIDRE